MTKLIEVREVERHILAGLCIFLFCVAFTAIASAETHYVYPGESIQAAVDAASSGNTIFVYNGSYFENVVVDKSLIITGEDKNTTIVNGDGSRAVVAINAANCVIHGFTVKNGSNGIHLNPPLDTTRTLTHDETWSGVKLINETIIVPEGVTLNIEPGTVIKFKHYRGYKEPWRRIGITVDGGTLKAVGTPEKQIWFTSDADNPINGDWQGISLSNTKNSEFNYVIVEFGEMGIEQFDSEVNISNSIIRWNNAEGLYAERSKPVFENNTLYGNGYHEIALEQYNQDVQILNNVFRDGHFAIHHEKTSSHIEGNYFKNYTFEAITAGMGSDIVVKRNKFENIGQDPPISVYGGSTAEIVDNDYGDGHIPIPEFDYEDIINYELEYIPGDPEDKFLYIYDEVDETRRTIKKIGHGLSFGWALVYAENSLWRFSLGSGEIGEELDFIKLDPITGSYQRFGNDVIMNPRGLTYDGEYFWVNDFSLLKIFKFTLDGNFIEILDSFDIPEKDKGGTSGLATDGDFLYLRSRDGSKLYKLDKYGTEIDEIHFGDASVSGAIVWTGNYFWTSGGCSKGLGKWTKDGELAGEIYPSAKDTWALAWDGNYLWSIQRTCEMWDDPKVYQIEILDDALQSSSNINNTITDNIISYNTGTGIVVDRSNNNTISRNFIPHNGYQGIHIQASQNSRAYGNTVSFSGDRGIVLESGRNNTVYDNIVHDNAAYGSIEVIRSTNNMIYNNIAYLNDWGIGINNGSYNQIQNNTIYSNDLGIHLDWTSNENNILGNNITDCNQGIALRNTATNNKIANNAISNNNQGIYVEFSYNNLFHHNSLINNTNQAYDDGTNTWDSGTEGNYWSDYEEKYPNATKLDGIWDTAYEIPGGDNQDNYPLVEPYTEMKYDGPLVDAHVHLPCGNEADCAVFESQLIEEMNKAGVVKAILEDNFRITPEGDELVLGIAERHPDRIIPFFSGFEPDDPNAVDYVRAQLDSGKWSGIGEILFRHSDAHTTYKPNDPAMFQIYDLAEQYNVPVHFHHQPSYMTNYEDGISEIREVLEAYPNVTFIWHVCYEAGELAKDYPNLICEMEFHHDMDYSWFEFDQDIIEQRRYIVGSDVSQPGVKGPTGLDYQSIIENTREVLGRYPKCISEEIAYKNILDILNLSLILFDTGASTNPYPSIMGTHKGEIKPSQNINVSKLYTYPCAGTGGHTESIKLYENGELIASGTWNGYQDEWHNITITPSVTLLAGHTYNYTIVTGSYPQIIHAKSKDVTGGTITCTSFVDANGKIYYDWIPAIRLE